jgi:tetratricopeptide (TPR) repeat protein
LRYAEEQQRREPARSEWAVMAGYAWFRMGDYARAIALFSPVTLNSPESIWAWNLLGESQRLAKQPDRATRTLERASTIGRSSFATFFLLGEAYRDSGRLDRAVTAYGEAVRLEPEFARGWFELGAASIRIGEITQARAALEQVEKLDPKLGKALRSRFPPPRK